MPEQRQGRASGRPFRFQATRATWLTLVSLSVDASQSPLTRENGTSSSAAKVPSYNYNPRHLFPQRAHRGDKRESLCFEIRSVHAACPRIVCTAGVACVPIFPARCTKYVSPMYSFHCAQGPPAGRPLRLAVPNLVKTNKSDADQTDGEKKENMVIGPSESISLSEAARICQC